MYKSLNDYELMYMICENNSETFKILYEKYKPLIIKIVSKYKRNFKNYGYEIEDLMQIGYLSLYKASTFYNEMDTSKFITYLHSTIKKNLYNEIRNNTTYKKKILNEAISYDLEDNLNLLEMIPDKKKEDYNKERKNFIIFKNSLDFNLSCIFELFHNGYPIDEISIFLNEDRKQIIKKIKEIKEKIIMYKEYI